MKRSIYLDAETEFLMDELRHEGEGVSEFIQRAIREAGAAQGIVVVTKVTIERQ